MSNWHIFFAVYFISVSINLITVRSTLTKKEREKEGMFWVGAVFIPLWNALITCIIIGTFLVVGDIRSEDRIAQDEKVGGV